jgi:hypothetical protein
MLGSNCSIPPVADSEDLSPSKNNPLQSYPSQSKPAQSQTLQTRLLLSSTVSSTLYLSQTVNDCLLACSTISTLGSIYTSCYSTTCYNTITACSTTGSTTFSVASTATSTISSSRYLIYTAEGVSQGQINNLNSILISELGTSNITQILLGCNSSIFIAIINLSIAIYLRRNPAVSNYIIPKFDIYRIPN